ncbi:MAG: hypothetical protein K2R98_03145 [Gemmataceae bacterium]|nr:hypothetical protein [Gemmataceae bacterium]
MLPERVTQLLTAYIDGELSSRQRRAVSKLLRKSPEARHLLQEMQQDSMILRKLPRRRPTMDLSKTVLTTLDMRGIKLPKPPPMPAPARLPAAARMPNWLAVAAAVLVLVAISAGSYLFFASTAPTIKGKDTTTAPR